MERERGVVYVTLLTCLFISGHFGASEGADPPRVLCQAPAVDYNISLSECGCEPSVLHRRPCSHEWLATLNISTNSYGISGAVIDHLGMPWEPTDGDEVWGVHCNISAFRIVRGRTVYIQPWNGSVGGRLVVEAAGDVLVEGVIDGTGRGYHEGVLGEGYPGAGHAGRTHILLSSGVASTGIAGSGGSYGTLGQASRPSTRDSSPPGAVYGTPCLPGFPLGSGGGSGGSAPTAHGNFSPLPGRGGSGGASVYLYSLHGNIQVPSGGVVQMDGAAGVGDINATCGTCPAACTSTGCESHQQTACYDYSGSGGGGSGGSVHFTAASVVISGTVTANGGAGGVGSYTISGCAGNGGQGRVRIDTNNLLGVTTPAAGNMDTFSYCPCNSTGTTMPPTTTSTSPVLPTLSPETTGSSPTVHVQTPSTSGAGGGGASGITSGAASVTSPPGTASVTGAVSAASSQTPSPTGSTTQGTTSVVGAGGRAGVVTLPIWTIVLIVLAAIMLSIVFILLVCVIRRRRKSIDLQRIPQSPGGPHQHSKTSIMAIQSPGSVQAMIPCAICPEGTVCVCQLPASIANPNYNDAQILVKVPRSPHGAGSEPQYSPAGPLTSPTESNRTAATQGSRHYSSSSVVSSSRHHHYDQVEGSEQPNGPIHIRSFRNPNYEVKIPIAVQADSPQSETSPRSPTVEYKNIPSASPPAVPAMQRSVVSPTSPAADCATDATGYLIADGIRRQANANNNVLSAPQLDSSHNYAALGPASEQARAIAPATSDMCLHDSDASVFRFPEQQQNQQLASPNGACLTAYPEHLDGHHRKDSGIEADASCYPVEGSRDIVHSPVAKPTSLSISNDVRRPMSAEPAKSMSPIPEHLSPRSMSSVSASMRLNSPPRAGPPHEYATISEIHPPPQYVNQNGTAHIGVVHGNGGMHSNGGLHSNGGVHSNGVLPANGILPANDSSNFSVSAV